MSDPVNIFQAVLTEGLKTFELMQGIISRIEDSHYKVLAALPRSDEISVGMVSELKNMYCHAGKNEHDQQPV